MPDSPTQIRFVAGLGNPGGNYERTRHNVGFMVLDRLAEHAQAEFKHDFKWKANVAKTPEAYFMKPTTYMNLSGEAICPFARFFKIQPEETLIVYDDVDLPLGKLRLRPTGSHGGHNGMRSIIQHFGTSDFPRLRFGIGKSERTGDGLTGHVLGKFAPDEMEALEKGLDEAVAAIHHSQQHGFDSAMNQFNRREKKPKPKKTSPDTEEPAQDTTTEPSSNNA